MSAGDGSGPNGDLVAAARPTSGDNEAPRPTNQSVQTHLVMQTNEEAKKYYEIVQGMYKKVVKIFKLRMRSGTFPVVCMSDLARVMRDLGLIPSVKKGLAKVKEVWFKIKAETTTEPDPATLPPPTEDNAFRPGPVIKRDHISFLLSCLQ